MSPVDAASIKSRLSLIFHRKGKSGVYTRLVEDFDPRQLESLSKAVGLRNEELPVLGSVLEGEWLMLTTERLVWLVDGQRTELQLNEIEDASIDLLQLNENYTKMDVEHLEVKALGGRLHRVRVESGGPLSGIWNVLRSVGLSNRRSVSGKR